MDRVLIHKDVQNINAKPFLLMIYFRFAIKLEIKVQLKK